MSQELSALELKQRKLIFLFGEKLFDLSRAGDVSWRYSADGEQQRKEIEKIQTLLNY